MLDVHVLVSESTKKEWVDQCLMSVYQARDRADYPIRIDIVPGIPGHIGKGRAKAYAKGSAPWKTYVDDDDFLLPNAFVDLGKYLHLDKAAIFTREQTWQNGRIHPGTIADHHLQVYRSEIVRSYNHHLTTMSDVWCRELAKRDPRGTLSVDDVTYVHRVYYDSKARVLRRKNPSERDALIKEFR